MPSKSSELGLCHRASFCRAGTGSGRLWRARDSFILIRVTGGVAWNEEMGRMALEPVCSPAHGAGGLLCGPRLREGLPLSWPTPHPPLGESQLGLAHGALRPGESRVNILRRNLSLSSPDQDCPKPPGHLWSAGVQGLAGQGSQDSPLPQNWGQGGLGRELGWVVVRLRDTDTQWGTSLPSLSLPAPSPSHTKATCKAGRF